VTGPIRVIPGSSLGEQIVAALAVAKENPNPYPHRVVHDRMAYDWYCWSGAAKYELAGRNKAWLAGACRERRIAASKMTRKQMIDALVEWQVDAETRAGWTPTTEPSTTGQETP
jgi:hypothetical protein